MRLDGITLNGFRNYDTLSLQFDGGVNLIVGDNAQGKTNLLEAIGFLGSGRSFRTQKNAELVKLGASFGEIDGDIYSMERQQNIRWLLFPGRKPRQLYCNGAKKKTAAQINGILQTVLFCPEDLMVLKTGAGERRRFCDAVLCQLRPNYEAAVTRYRKVLEQKNEILKHHFEDPALLDLMPEYDEQICQVGAVILSYRARFFQGLEREAKVFHETFSGGKEEFCLTYKTVSTVKDPFAPAETLAAQLREHLESHRRAELESGQCLTGPHKDDFEVLLSGLPVKTYGSQGQVRTAAISLKLAQRELMKKDTGEIPVLLLDDVLSELDPMRRDFVLNRIRDGQVFITACEPDICTEAGATVIIKNGKVY